jgi:hypothetical protein
MKTNLAPLLVADFRLAVPSTAVSVFGDSLHGRSHGVRGAGHHCLGQRCGLGAGRRTAGLALPLLALLKPTVASRAANHPLGAVVPRPMR